MFMLAPCVPMVAEEPDGATKVMADDRVPLLMVMPVPEVLRLAICELAPIANCGALTVKLLPPVIVCVVDAPTFIEAPDV